MTTLVDQLADRMVKLEERLNQLLMTGNVSQVDGKKYMVKVKFPSLGGLESDWLQVLTAMSHMDKVYLLPDIDDQVKVLNVPGAQEVGCVIGTLYSQKNGVPVGTGTPDVSMINFLNGSFLRHDRASGDLNVEVTGNITIAAGGNIDMGAAGYAKISAGDKIDIEAPSSITLGDADIINVNSKTATKIVGSTELYLAAKTLTKVQSGDELAVHSDGTVEVSSFSETSISSVASFVDIYGFQKVSITSDGIASLSGLLETKISSDGTASFSGTLATNISSGAITSVSGTTNLLLGATTIMTSGIFFVEIFPIIYATIPPMSASAAETAAMKSPAPPGAAPAGLLPYTTAAPQPIDPTPYVYDPIPAVGKTPNAPKPGEGATREALIQ